MGRSFTLVLRNRAALFIGLALLALAACSVTRSTPERSMLADGSVMISRPAPALAPMEKLSSLGFLPLYPSPTGNWLLIDTQKKTASLMEGDRLALVADAKGTDALRPGRFQLVYRQRNPLWYAPASYFERRKLPVPPEGDKARFRRGALGDFVLYLTKEIPIHSGPVWSEDVGGVKLDDMSMTKMYYMLPVGATIEVR